MMFHSHTMVSHTQILPLVCGKQETNNAPTATQPANPPTKQQKHAQDAMLPASTCTAPWLLPFVQRSPILEVYRDKNQQSALGSPWLFPPSLLSSVYVPLAYILSPADFMHTSQASLKCTCLPFVIVAVAQSYIGRCCGLLNLTATWPPGYVRIGLPACVSNHVVTSGRFAIYSLVSIRLHPDRALRSAR